MLRELQIKNFLAHQHTTLQLGRAFTVLVGPNGAGKTTALRALHYLSQLTDRSPADVFRFPWDIASLAARESDPVCLSASGIEEGEPWSMTLQASRSNGGWHCERKCRYGLAELSDATLDDVHAESLPWHTPEGLQNVFRHAVLLNFTTSRLAEPSVTRHPTPRVEFDGYGLASCIAYLRLEEPDRFEALVESLRTVLPGVERVLVRQVELQQRFTREHVLDDQRVQVNARETRIAHELLISFAHAERVPGRFVSEGTLHTLGLLAAMHHPSCPRLILIDDLGHTLHPAAQVNLVRSLKSLLAEDPTRQVVATSHSPYLVDELSANDVYVLADRGGAGIAARLLSDHEDREKALSMLTTGEFWSAVGEAWPAATDASTR